MSAVKIPANAVKLIRLPASCLRPKLVGLGPHNLPITDAIWKKLNKKSLKYEFWCAFIMGDGQVVYSHKKVATEAAATRQTIFYAGLKRGKMVFVTRKYAYLVDPDHLSKVKRTKLGHHKRLQPLQAPNGYTAVTEPFEDGNHSYQWAQADQHLLLLEVA